MAKSHVYGLGRNRKHRPPQHGYIESRAAGNVNLRGKKSRLMSCRCCECIDFRDKIRYYEDKKLMQNYLRGLDEQ